jgi:ProP effector
MDSKRQQKRAAIGQAIELLAQRFPKCFAVTPARRRPLKVGIAADLVQRLDTALSSRLVPATLAAYTHHRRYRQQLVAGAKRLDLDGMVVGAVTIAEAQQAAAAVKSAKPAPPKPAKAKATRPPERSPKPAAAATAAATKRLSLADLQAAALHRKQALR